MGSDDDLATVLDRLYRRRFYEEEIAEPGGSLLVLQPNFRLAPTRYVDFVDHRMARLPLSAPAPVNSDDDDGVRKNSLSR